ncbi:hypothetical protein GCM10020331_071990 [Ectobacillus funiculus]
MYGEHFDIPAPDELIFMSWFEGGEVFRSGCTYKRGNGKKYSISDQDMKHIQHITIKKFNVSS